MPKKIKLVTDLYGTNGLLVNFVQFPYAENQSYFTNDGRIFQDKGEKRLFLSKVNIIYQENDSGSADYTDFKGQLVVVFESPDYLLYYVKENTNGTVSLVGLGGGGGGSPPIPGVNIGVDGYTVNLDRILTDMETITYFDDDFVIGQGASAIDEAPTEIIKIWQSDTGGTNSSKIELKNGKTYIEEIDTDIGLW